jgi:uncharacterized protein
VAPNDRELRIEVGYGLEGTLPDATADAIIRNVIIPRFKAGNTADGISDGVEAIIAVLSGTGEEFRPVLQETTAEKVAQWIPAGMFVVLVMMAIAANIRDRRRGRSRYYRSGNGRWIHVDDADQSWGGYSRGGWGGGGFGGGSSGGGFSGGGGSFGGGGASGRW